MAVTLRVSSYQAHAMGPEASRVFSHGGTIGRAPDNDWVLPDPERFVSSRHAVISVDNGACVLTDHSTNGTIVNGSELPRGGSVELRTGDRLTIGNYDIDVSVESSGQAAAYPSSPPAAAGHASAFGDPSAAAGSGDTLAGAAGSVDPLDFFGEPSPPAQNRVAPPAAEPDHTPPGSDYFAPPNVRPEPRHAESRSFPDSAGLGTVGGAGGVPQASGAAPQSGHSPIPENWDQTDFSSPTDPAPASTPPAGDDPFFGLGAGGDSPDGSGPLSGAGGSAPGGDRPTSSDAPFPEQDFWSEPAAPSHADATLPPSAGAARQPAFGDSQPPAADPEGFAPPAAAPPTAAAPPNTAGRSSTAPGPTSAARQSVSADDTGVAALLRSAGIDPADVDDATMASLGEVLQVVVAGLMDVLRARTAIKNQFRVPMTTLKPVENNPLKFSADANDALFNLLARRNRSYQAPVDAFREAFDDLRAHQIAMMAGMRAAFSSLMRRFDPDVLQEDFDRGLKRGALLEVMNRTKYWELYREMYEGLGDDDATFRRLFGDEFAEAYEEQMQRLTTLRKQ